MDIGQLAMSGHQPYRHFCVETRPLLRVSRDTGSYRSISGSRAFRSRVTDRHAL